MTSKTLLSCGHTNTTYDKQGNRTCAVCYGTKEIKPIRFSKQMLEGRQAMCIGHKGAGSGIVPSSLNLPHFKYCPKLKYDSYYCGCWGWQ